MSLASLLQLGSNPVRQPPGMASAAGKFTTPGANPSRLRVTNPDTGAETRKTVKFGKPTVGAPARVPQGPSSLDVFAPPAPPEPPMARPTQLGNKGLLGRLSSSIGDYFGRTNPPLSPSSGYSQPGGTPGVAPPTPTAPGTPPLISQPSVTPYQAAGGGAFQRPFNAAAPPTPIGGFGNAPPAPPAPAAGASAAPVSPQAGPWGNVSSSGQAGVPYGAPPPASPPPSLGQRVMGGLGNIKQAGVRGNISNVGKGLKSVARGGAKAALNPIALATAAPRVAAWAGGLEDALHGPEGYEPNTVSVQRGMSNLAHAIPGVGGLSGAVWDAVPGHLFNAGADLTEMGVMNWKAAHGDDRARAAQEKFGTNLMSTPQSIGDWFSDAWSGKPPQPQVQPDQSRDEIHRTFGDPDARPHLNRGEMNMIAQEQANAGDEQMKWLMSLPDKGQPGARPLPPGTQGSAPSTPGVAARQQATGSLAAQAPKTGGDSAAVLQPGTMNAPPSPSAGGDPLGGMLSDQLMNAMRTPFSPPFPADAFDGVELGNAPGQGGFARHMAMVNAQAAANHNQGLGQSYDMLMGYKQHQAAMANAQAQQQLAQANSMGEAMRGRAALMQADPLQQYLGSPAGVHVLEQQSPGLRDAMQFPESMAAPGGAELMRKPDLSADEAMAWDKKMHAMGQGDRHHEMLKSIMMRRLGPGAIDEAGTEGGLSRALGWIPGIGRAFDDSGRASSVREWLSHMGM